MLMSLCSFCVSTAGTHCQTNSELTTLRGQCSVGVFEAPDRATVCPVVQNGYSASAKESARFVVAKKPWMAASFNESQKTFRMKISFKKKFDARVRVCKCFWLSSRVRLCSLKFQRARLPALYQILACLHAMPSILIPAYFQRARLSALSQILSC